MYYSLGSDRSIETISTLSQLHFGSSEPELTALKAAYLNFLGTRQSNVWHPQPERSRYLFNKTIIQNLISQYREENKLTGLINDISIADNASMHAALTAIDAGIEYIKEYEPELYDLFNLVINTLYYARSNKQIDGSVSSAVGVIWCRHRRNWNMQDIVEFLVRELTHNLLFLDELRYQHFHSLDLLSDKKNFARSAILNTLNPLDKVFHSLVVAIEVVALRRFWLGDEHVMHVHPDNETMIDNCFETLASIKSIPNLSELVTKRFYELLESMTCCVENINRIIA